MPTPKNQKLYNQVKHLADKLYSKSSAYKSGYIVKKYKELGGEYLDDNQPKNLKRWFKEDWEDIGHKEYLQGRFESKLGIKDAKFPLYPVYRPTKRVNKKTPLTIQEIKPSNLKDQILLKQLYKGDKNLPPFIYNGH
jgi:hypothetical protein